MSTNWKARAFRPSIEGDVGDAFVRDYRKGFVRIGDGDVEAFGREFVAAATSNDAVAELARDEAYAEELGGLVFDIEDDPFEDLDPA